MEEQLKVLKVMSEVTGRIDMNAFAQMVGLNPSQTIERMQDLVNAGLIKKTGGGYGITEKGRVILKAITPVPKDKAFHFYTGFGQPTGFSAESLKDFYEIVKRVTAESLDFHLYRGDFENWIENALKDAVLADELANLKSEMLKGEELRQRILKAIAARYSFNTAA
jgi:DNA-binding Lrp family transcriptional regulator